MKKRFDGCKQLKTVEATRSGAVSLLKTGLYAAAAIPLYYSTLVYLFGKWSGEDYSYCWFVPLIVLYLIWEKRTELARFPSTPSWFGLIPFLIGLSLFWLGELGGEYTMLLFSLWFVVVGLVWLDTGWQKVHSLSFPFAILFVCFPLPYYIETQLTLHAKMVSSRLGAWMLYAAGIPVYREGNVIDLGFTKLQVVDACSGLRYILPLMLIGLLLAYWFRAHTWKRAALFLSSIPLSILMNGFRIALTGVLYGAIGPEAAEGFFHEFSGWLIFVAALPIFLALMFILKKLPPKDLTLLRGKDKTVCAGTPPEPSAVKTLLQPQFLTGLSALLLIFALNQGVDFRQKVPIIKPFSQFPSKVGQWAGTRQTMERQFLDALSFSDYILEDYANPQGKAVNLYVAYYQDQRKGESIHSPESCLPGSGWTFREAGETSIPLSDGRSSLPVSRAFMEKAGVRELSYFWFPQRGRILTKLYQLKIFTFWDSLTEQRTDGALVRLITPVYSSETLQDADERLQTFTRQIVPILDEYIPGKHLK